MKKYWREILLATIILPTAALCWQFIIQPWLLPPKVATLEAGHAKSSEEISKIEDLSREFEGRIAQTEQQQHEQSKINELQVQSLKDQLAIIKDLKK